MRKWSSGARFGIDEPRLDIDTEFHLEGLRQAIGRERRVHSGQRAFARSLGPGRAVVRTFIEMRSVPRAGHLDRLLGWAADRPEPRLHPAPVLLALLVSAVPARARFATRARIARILAEAHADSAAGVPEWIGWELPGVPSRTRRGRP